MAYFKINNIDFSHLVNELKVSNQVNYNAQTNAAGNTVVDYINTKRTLEVGFIPMDNVNMLKVQQAINAFNVSVSFLNPNTNLLEDNINCIIPSNEVDYYTIRVDKVMYNAMTITIMEL